MAEISVIESRFQKAKADRAEYDTYMDTGFRYSVPQRRIYLETQNKMRPNPEIYDSTAVIGVQKFASKLQSMLVPTMQTWMKFKDGNDYDSKDQAYADRQSQYDKDTKIFFDELKMSNFDIQVAESFQDLAVTTGALLINPSPLGSPNAVTYKAIPIYQLYVENPDDGLIRNVWRQHTMRIDEIEMTYVTATLSARHKEELLKNPNATVEVTESCIYDYKTNTYDVDVVDMKSKHYFKQIVEDESPWVVFRENVVAGSVMGFGRVMRVLPDIQMLNKVKQLMVQGGSMAISGTFTAHDDGVLNPYNVRLRAGAVIPVNSNDSQNPSIRRLDTPTNFDWGNMEIAQLQETINTILLSNPFGSIDSAPVRSATEIASRNKDLFDTMASSFGRMQVEFIHPVIRRTTYLLKKAGRIGDHVVLNGKETSVDFISPLTRLQQSADVENVLEWLAILGSYGEETLQLGANMDAVPAWLAEQYSIPQVLVKTQEAQGEAVSAKAEMDVLAQGGGIAPPELGEVSVGGLDPSVA